MSSIRERLYYFWKKASEKQMRKKYESDNYKNDIERYKKCTSLKPAAQIKKEMKVLEKHWDCLPYQYYRFDMYRSDCPLSLDEMKEYIPHFFQMNLFFPLSYKDYGILCEDKQLTYAMLKAYGIRQPNMLLGFDNGKVYGAANQPLCREETDAVLSASSAQKIFLKPRFGLGGRGIMVFSRRENNTFVDEKNEVLSYKFLTEHLKDDAYIAQEGMVQHPDLSKIYAHSVNTFRVMTECVNGQPKIIYALFRMGSGGQQIDNASSGGMYLKVDVETGKLADFAYNTNRDTFYTHPDSGFVFRDGTIEKWAETKAFALEVTKKFREIKYMGWDIAFSTDGPTVIELNNAPGLNIIQDCYGGLASDLNITPKDWWYKKNFTLKNL
jgi:hypothetical protein